MSDSQLSVIVTDFYRAVRGSVVRMRGKKTPYKMTESNRSIASEDKRMNSLL